MPKLEEGLKLKGTIRIQEWPHDKYPTYASIMVARRRGEKPLREYVSEKLIVTAGKNHVADVLIATVGVQADLQYGNVGTSNQAPAVSDTDLIAAIGSRVAFTDRFRTNNIATITFYFPGGTGADAHNGQWEEFAIFWLATGNDMLDRSNDISVNKTAAVAELIEFDLTVG